jgi:hypothetical protein
VTRRVVLLVAAAALAAGAAAGTYVAVRGGGDSSPASQRDPYLEAAKRQGLVQEYHALQSVRDGDGAYRYLVDNHIVLRGSTGGFTPYGSPIYISYRDADAREARSLARLLRRRGQPWVILGPLGEPASSDFGS